MKATDLMIGDWVLCSSLPEAGFCKVLGIDSPRKGENEYIVEMLDQHSIKLWVYERFIKPIPLTAEILEKNGFVETDVVVVGTRKMIWESEDGRTEITIWMDDTMPMRICKNIYYEDEVCYTLPFACAVHELQHALRLCGIERNIVV